MKAVVLTEDGDRVHVLEIADPTPGAGQVRVRLAAAGVNPVDGKSAFGVYGGVYYPFVPGTDGAGTVDLLGEGVTRFSEGDRVFGRLTVSMGLGTYAEYSVGGRGRQGSAPCPGSIRRTIRSARHARDARRVGQACCRGEHPCAHRQSPSVGEGPGSPGGEHEGSSSRKDGAHHPLDPHEVGDTRQRTTSYRLFVLS